MQLLREALRVLYTTVETGCRGFLLGFGGAILKDLLVDRKAMAEKSEDYQGTFRFARVAGLGSACFLVGASILVPADWRHSVLTRSAGL